MARQVTDSSISHGFGTPNKYPEGPEQARRVVLAASARCLFSSCGFLRSPQSRLDASTTFARRLRGVIYRGGGVEPSRPRTLAITLHSASKNTSPTRYQTQPQLAASLTVDLTRDRINARPCTALRGRASPQNDDALEATARARENVGRPFVVTSATQVQP